MKNDKNYKNKNKNYKNKNDNYINIYIING